jgi:hypothetical protein
MTQEATLVSAAEHVVELAIIISPEQAPVKPRPGAAKIRTVPAMGWRSGWRSDQLMAREAYSQARQ